MSRTLRFTNYDDGWLDGVTHATPQGPKLREDSMKRARRWLKTVEHERKKLAEKVRAVR